MTVKTPHTLAARYKQNKLEPSRKLSRCWLPLCLIRQLGWSGINDPTQLWILSTTKPTCLWTAVTVLIAAQDAKSAWELWAQTPPHHRGDDRRYKSQRMAGWRWGCGKPSCRRLCSWGVSNQSELSSLNMAIDRFCKLGSLQLHIKSWFPGSDGYSQSHGHAGDLNTAGYKTQRSIGKRFVRKKSGRQGWGGVTTGSDERNQNALYTCMNSSNNKLK